MVIKMLNIKKLIKEKFEVKIIHGGVQQPIPISKQEQRTVQRQTESNTKASKYVPIGGGYKVLSNSPINMVGNKYVIPAGSTVLKPDGTEVKVTSQCFFMWGSGGSWFYCPPMTNKGGLN